MRMKSGVSTCVLLLGCTGYVAEQPLSSPPPPPPPIEAASAVPIAAADAGQVMTSADSQSDGEQGELTLRIAHGEKLADYLTDGDGRALYMFADDVPDRDEAACVGDCVSLFLPFDLPLDPDHPPRFASDIDAREVTRMHRQDGAWQLRYKGHPLYQRAFAPPADVSADGLDGRWFVARDYFAFFSTTDSFEPLGTDELRRLYLTDGFGRTLYVCLDDTPASGSAGPSSACSGACLGNRPPFSASASLRTTRLPSSLVPSVLGAFVRGDGIVQLTYRGWPLYYFRGDAVTGDTHGHNQGAWRAIDPIAFGEGETH